jgi:hypothetical protein
MTDIPQLPPPPQTPRSASFSGSLSPLGRYGSQSPRRIGQADDIAEEGEEGGDHQPPQLNPFNFETRQYLVGPAPNSIKPVSPANSKILLHAEVDRYLCRMWGDGVGTSMLAAAYHTK